MKAKLIFILLLGSMILSPGITAFAQDESKFGADPETCKVNISLYTEFYRQWKDSKYKSDVVLDAVDPWRKVLIGCPAAQESTYVNGIRIMKYLVNKEKDQALREKYIDTLLMLYDQRIQYFGKEGSVLAEKEMIFTDTEPKNSRKLMQFLRDQSNFREINLKAPILNYYFRTMAKMVREEVVEKANIIDAYDKVSAIIDFNLEKYANDARRLESWKTIKGNIEAEFEPFATCDDLISIYQIKYDANKEDVQLLNKIIDILDKKGCEETQLYFDATVQLYKMEPSPASAYLIGRMYMIEEDYVEALKYLQEATALEDEEDLAKIYFYMAKINQTQNKKSEARRNARKAIEKNPSYGDAYILIGDLYGTSAKDCGGNDLTNRVAYWAAVDKYQKAKQVDETVAEIANKRIRDYSAHFPTTETIFFYNLQEGDTYKVECWINENTRVRAAK